MPKKIMLFKHLLPANKRPLIYAGIALLSFFLFFKASGQAPVITPKSPVVLPLDNTGNKTITLNDIATVSSSNGTPPSVTFSPTSFSCTTLGPQVVKVTAATRVASPAAVSFENIIGMIVTPNGDLVSTDFNNNNIRVISPDGNVTTANSGDGSPYSDNSGQNNSTFAFPGFVVADKTGNIYVSSNDEAEHTIQKITPLGVTTTVISEYSRTDISADGTIATATLEDITGLAVDKAGNIYFTEIDSKVREITTSGNVITIAGSPEGFVGFQNGTGSNALFNYPQGLTIDGSGNLYLSDRDNFAIRKITPQGVVSTLAGGTYGFANGTGTSAQFSGLGALATDAAGNVYVADNNSVRKITPAGMVTTLAGSSTAGLQNGTGAAATFSGVYSVAVDADGNVFVNDRGNDVIRKITPQGVVTTYAGSGQQGDTNGNIFSGTGPSATLNIPVTVTGGLSITTAYPDVTIPVTGNCPAMIPDFLVTNPVTTDNCTNIISFAQHPGFGSPITGAAPITVTLTATDDLGNTANVSFTLTPQNTPPGQPSVTISPTPSGVICPGTAITFSPTPVKAVNPTYEWFVNGNSKGVAPFFTSNAFADGDVVNCIMTCSVLCGALTTITSAPVTVHVSAVSGPVVTVSPQQVSVCAGTPVNFTASLNSTFPQALYQWQINGVNAGTNSATFTAIALNDGDLITCTVIGNAGCNAPATSLPVTAHISQLPQISYGNNITINKGGTIQLQPITTSDIANYSWSPATGLTSTTIANPIASPQVTTVYSVTVTNAAGCQKTIPVTVNVTNSTGIPNAFTPNNDGTNDTWNIALLANYPNCTVDIFNRYGKGVYHTTGYTKAWDGSCRGSKVPVGTYYYVIDLQDGSKKLAGYVEVVY